jgi:phenylalanine ammonia-lyase
LGRTIYGVNTGFGGSADTRTKNFERLQIALQQHLNIGILLPSDKGINTPLSRKVTSELLRGHALPVPVVKAMMLIRCNSLLRGHSGVRVIAIQAILRLLSKNMTPVVPLRGSISASGDLSSLSYIAGAIEGNPDVFIQVGNDSNDDNNVTSSIYIPAHEALKRADLQPIRLQAKEGLGITNGTAASCAYACITIHQAQQLAVLTQLLTAMGTEALLGTACNYDPFISAARPHPGQIEAAANIRAFLSRSQLSPDKGPETLGLAQDRYALRTAPQWIGPQLEDLLLAQRQISIEVNSTTDNPLIDVAGHRIHHGGNFQAASITSAMEKTMTALQNLGRLLFAQSSELINNLLNKGLPPNLSADDPSLSFTFKGFDVNMAAYMSELAYLAHPVSTHGQIAEMGNQSVNSLALLTARYALEAVEVLSLMAATFIYTLCQALDLRCLHFEFVKQAEPAIHRIVSQIFYPIVAEDKEALKVLGSKAWEALLEKWVKLSHHDLVGRGQIAARESVGAFSEALMSYLNHQNASPSNIDLLGHVLEYQRMAGSTLSEVYDRTRKAFFLHQTTPQYISTASKIIYDYVRTDLKVPMHRGVIDHPTLVDEELRCNGVNSDIDGTFTYEHGKVQSLRGKILGTMASEIYLAVRNGQLHARVMEAWDKVQTDGS